MKHYSLLSKAMLTTMIALLFMTNQSWAQDVIPIVAGQSYYEDFESGSLNGWTVESTGNGTWAVMTGTESSVAAFQNAATGDEARLISPVFDMSGIGSATLSFGYAIMAIYNSDILSVCYRSSETDSWHEISNYTTNDWNAHEDTFELPNISSTYQISFLGHSNGGIYIFVDNIIIAPNVVCARPMDLEANEITPFSALLQWSTTGNEEQWIIDLNDQQMTVKTQPFLMENLDPWTDYTFRVQAICEDGMSEWSYPMTFKTLCDVITVTDNLPYFDDFEASENFVCWQNEIVSGDGGWVVDPGYLVLNNTAFFIWLNEEAWLISTPLDIMAVTNPTLEFKHKQPYMDGVSEDLIVAYRKSTIDEWHIIGVYNYAINDWETISLALPDASAEYQIGFKGISHNGNGAYIDDVWVGNVQGVGVMETPVIMATATPNPATDNVIISANINLGEVVVYDLYGRQVATAPLRDGQAIVDLSGCAQGVYMAQIQDGNSVKTIRLVKE